MKRTQLTITNYQKISLAPDNLPENYSITLTWEHDGYSNNSGTIAGITNEDLYPVPTRDILYTPSKAKKTKNHQHKHQQPFSIITSLNKIEIVLPTPWTNGRYLINNGITTQKFILNK